MKLTVHDGKKEKKKRKCENIMVQQYYKYLGQSTHIEFYA